MMSQVDVEIDSFSLGSKNLIGALWIFNCARISAADD